MKINILNENGKLFGKINIFDFTALLFLSILIFTFYLESRIFRERKQERNNQEANTIETKKIQPAVKKEWIDLKCLFIKLNPNIAERLEVGDKEIDSTGQVIAEVVKLGKVSPYSYKFKVDTREITVNDPTLKQRSAALKIKAEKVGDNLYYKGEQITENSLIYVHITKEYLVKTVPIFKIIPEEASPR